MSALPEDERAEVLSQLTDKQALALLFEWRFWARQAQVEPGGNWRRWLLLAGRGFGKTRSGTEWVREQIESGRCRQMALVARTVADTRDVLVEGKSGLLKVCPPWNRPIFERSKRRLTWPNGATATLFSADKPDQLRGPEFDGALADEICAWRRPEAWMNLQMSTRHGEARIVAMTTPRNQPLLKKLLAQLESGRVVKTGGSTFDNADNLSEDFIEEIRLEYEGTRLGRQELNAEILDDNPDALWQRETMIERYRVKVIPGSFLRIVVGVDPSTTSEDSSAETGIIVAALASDGHYYVLADYSLKASPNRWARRVCAAYRGWQAHRVVGEANNGGDLIESVIRRATTENISFKKVWAKQNKVTRAEPIATLYERGLVHHINCFPELEDQMCNWTPGKESPDRLDALVWALTELSGRGNRKVQHGASLYD